MNSIRELSAAVHRCAQEKGWWEEWDEDAPITSVERALADIACDHGTLSQVLEEARVGEGWARRSPRRPGPDPAEPLPGSPKRTRVLVKLALIHSEVSEAVEACLEGRYGMHHEASKPEGMVVELADVVIRIMDLCAKLELDLEGAIQAKAAYNATRPYRHGGKKA